MHLIRCHLIRVTDEGEREVRNFCIELPAIDSKDVEGQFEEMVETLKQIENEGLMCVTEGESNVSA